MAVEEAEKYALEEIKKYGTPIPFHFEIANRIGFELAKKLKLDSEIVQVGTRLMDIKLGQALQEGKPQEHIQMSVQATKDFIENWDLSKDKKEKIINCVEGHHGRIKWICKEAELVANADCYRFLNLRSWLVYLAYHAGEGSFDEALDFAEKKADEKWNILSLDICRKELEPQYNLIKEIAKQARKP